MVDLTQKTNAEVIAEVMDFVWERFGVELDRVNAVPYDCGGLGCGFQPCICDKPKESNRK